MSDKVDIIELCLTDLDGEEMAIRMTPDEALTIVAMLSQVVEFYLKEFNESYKKLFVNEIKTLSKNRKKRELHNKRSK